MRDAEGTFKSGAKVQKNFDICKFLVERPQQSCSKSKVERTRRGGNPRNRVIELSIYRKEKKLSIQTPPDLPSREEKGKGRQDKIKQDKIKQDKIRQKRLAESARRLGRVYLN